MHSLLFVPTPWPAVIVKYRHVYIFIIIQNYYNELTGIALSEYKYNNNNTYYIHHIWLRLQESSTPTHSKQRNRPQRRHSLWTWCGCLKSHWSDTYVAASTGPTPYRVCDIERLRFHCYYLYIRKIPINYKINVFIVIIRLMFYKYKLDKY